MDYTFDLYKVCYTKRNPFKLIPPNWTWGFSLFSSQLKGCDYDWNRADKDLTSGLKTWIGIISIGKDRNISTNTSVFDGVSSQSMYWTPLIHFTCAFIALVLFGIFMCHDTKSTSKNQGITYDKLVLGNVTPLFYSCAILIFISLGCGMSLYQDSKIISNINSYSNYSDVRKIEITPEGGLILDFVSIFFCFISTCLIIRNCFSGLCEKNHVVQHIEPEISHKEKPKEIEKELNLNELVVEILHDEKKYATMDMSPKNCGSPENPKESSHPEISAEQAVNTAKLTVTISNE